MKGKLGVYLSKIENESGEFEILQLFESSLDTVHPDQGEIPIKLLGFGEISIVFEILTPELKGLAFKRLPLFESEAQVTRHIKAYHEYYTLLTEKVGLVIPEQKSAWVYMNDEHTKIALYCIQKKIPAENVVSSMLSSISAEKLKPIVALILQEFKKIWQYNRNNTEMIEIGLDGQISNWAYFKTPTGNHIEYLDTSTPLFRKDGEEAMEVALFLKSAPSFLQWMLKSLATEVVERYYNLRDVFIDLIANFYKEQRSDLIPALISQINEFILEKIPELEISPISEEEVVKYYKHDKFIWQLYLGLRRFDRFLKTKILRKKYDFYLPEKIKR
ncbi:MAG: hypothetical protein DRO88_00155 [Promethearchaeia archaeon]|nr:MAG: hypothetical protein DRO88_00155 [Candidatus Lokiarchaeia archaeon]